MKINTLPIDILKTDCESIDEFIEESYQAFLRNEDGPIKWDSPKKLRMGILFLNLDKCTGDYVTIRLIAAKQGDPDKRDLFMKIRSCSDDVKQYFINRLLKEEEEKLKYDLSGQQR